MIMIVPTWTYSKNYEKGPLQTKAMVLFRIYAI